MNALKPFRWGVLIPAVVLLVVGGAIASVAQDIEEVSPAALAWTRSGEARLGSFIDGVTTLPHGDVVILSHDVPMDGIHAWRSSDGATWDATTLPSSTDEAAFDIATTNDGVVVLGSGKLWTKAEDVEWVGPMSLGSAKSDGAYLWDVTTHTDGLAILGAMPAGKKRRDPTIWTSQDGLDWAATRIAKGSRDSLATHLARSIDGTWLAAGSDTKKGSRLGRLWRSMDGSTWEKVDFPVSSNKQYIVPKGLVSMPTGFVLAVDSYATDGTSSKGTLWCSATGEAWDKVAAFPAPIGVLSVVDETAFALVDPDVVTGTTPAFVSSTDCATWTEPASVELDGLVSSRGFSPLGDNGLVVVGGYDPGDGSFTQASGVWVGLPMESEMVSAPDSG